MTKSPCDLSCWCAMLPFSLYCLSGWVRITHLTNASATERRTACVCPLACSVCCRGIGTKHRKHAASESSLAFSRALCTVRCTTEILLEQIICCVGPACITCFHTDIIIRCSYSLGEISNYTVFIANPSRSLLNSLRPSSCYSDAVWKWSCAGSVRNRSQALPRKSWFAPCARRTPIAHTRSTLPGTFCYSYHRNIQ